MQHEITDTEISATVERTNTFIERLRAAINEAIAAVNPHSPCATEARAGLARIAATLDHVEYVTFANLANLDIALQRHTGSGLMSVIELHLLAVGGGPTLDYADATAFLAVFQPMVEMARKRHIN